MTLTNRDSHANLAVIHLREQALMLLGRLLLLPLLLLGAMATVEAAGSGTKHAVMTGIMTGDAADHGALQATLGLGAFGRDGERGDDEQCGNDFHGGAFL